MSSGAQQSVTIAVGGGRPQELIDNGLINFDVTETRTNERVPGPGPITYRNTKHNSGSVTLVVDDNAVTRPIFAPIGGEVVTIVHRESSTSTAKTYTVVGTVTITATAEGSITYNLSNEWASAPTS